MTRPTQNDSVINDENININDKGNPGMGVIIHKGNKDLDHRILMKIIICNRWITVITIIRKVWLPNVK